MKYRIKNRTIQQFNLLLKGDNGYVGHNLPAKETMIISADELTDQIKQLHHRGWLMINEIEEQPEIIEEYKEEVVEVVVKPNSSKRRS